MNATRAILLAAAAGISAACRPSAPDTTADEAAIRSGTEALVATMLAGDSVGAASWFTTTATMLPPNEPALTGQAEIRGWSNRMFSAMRMTSGAATVDAVHVGGDWAVSYGRWGMTVAMGATTASDTTRYMLLWQKQPNGDWRIARDLWNSGQPAAAPGR